MKGPTGSARFSPSGSIAVAILVVGVALAVVFTGAVRSEVRDRERLLFDSTVLVARDAIQEEVASFGLQGVRGLFVSSKTVTREEFHRFIVSRFVDQRRAQPFGEEGTAIAFARRTTPEQARALERRNRRDPSLKALGYPTFTVHPEPIEGKELFVADYVAPIEGNEDVVGYDLASEANRRVAIEQARDTGEVVASAPVNLVQGTRGILLVNAIYDTDRVPSTAPARRRHFIGVASAGLAATPLVERAIAGADGYRIEEIFDVGETIASRSDALSDEGLVYDATSAVSLRQPSTLPPLARTIDLDVGTRRWRILVLPGPGFQGSVAPYLPGAAGVLTLLITVLVAGLVFSFGRTRRRAIALASEMTEGIRLRDEELGRANELLERKNTAMREFVAIASHDLRSPVAALVGFSETLMLSWDKVPDEQKKEFIAILFRRSATLSDLINDLLIVTEIEGDAIQARPRSVLVGSVVDSCMEGRESHGWSVQGANDVAAFVDPTHLRRMVTNLLSNAEKYGAAPFEVSWVVADGVVSIAVRDSGDGVPEGFEGRLFEKFTRAESARFQGKEGTGLGLGIVRGLAKANGGDVTYESAGPGARFIITLPVNQR